MPTSAAQTAANQVNAQNSTGPRSEQGKAQSARNALRHGFRSQTVLLPGDDPADFQALLDTLTNHFAPVDLTDQRCVREMADAEWRLRRVREYLEITIEKRIAEIQAAHPEANEIELQALVWADPASGLAPLMKYEQKYERQYDRAYRTWLAYQELKTTIEYKEAREVVRKVEEEQREAEKMVHAALQNQNDQTNPIRPSRLSPGHPQQTRAASTS